MRRIVVTARPHTRMLLQANRSARTLAPGPSMLLALALALAVACGESNDGVAQKIPDGAWVQERDRRGDTTIVRVVGAASPAAELTLVRESATGREDGRPEEALASVNGVTPARNGGIFLLDGMARQVREFDSSGNYVRDIGHYGQGPGEYQSLPRIFVGEDGSIILSSTRKISVYSAAGDLQHDLTTMPDGARIGRLRGVESPDILHLQVPLPDSLALDAEAERWNPLRTTAIIRMTFDGMVIDTLMPPALSHQPRRFPVRLKGDSATRTWSVPYVSTAHYTYSPQGHWIIGGHTDSYAFVMLPRSGGPVRVESDLPAEAVTQAEREAALYRMHWELEPYHPDVLPTLDHIPTTKPHTVMFSTDDDARVWVRLSQPATRHTIDTVATAGGIGGGRPLLLGGPRPDPNVKMPRSTEVWVEGFAYDVFTHDGRFLGRFHMKEGATLAASMGDKVWLVERDQNDVPQVVRYRVASSDGGVPPVPWK